MFRHGKRRAAGCSSPTSPSRWSPASGRRATGGRCRCSAGGSVSGDRREERQAALRRELAAQELGALLVLHPANIRYLTGFTGSAGLLLVGADRTVLLTDFRYAEQAPQEAGGTAQVGVDPSDISGRPPKLLDAGGRLRLGFERDHRTVRDREPLGSLETAEPVPAGDLVGALRVVKDPDEVEALRAAANLAQAIGRAACRERV